MSAKHLRLSLCLRPLFGAVVCALAVGCQGPPAPPAANIPAGPVGDEAVLLALDCYEPMYQVDANGRVIKLRMTGRQLPEATLMEVGKLKELRSLDFYGVNLTDDGLAHLKDLQKLKALGIGGTLVTDQGLVHLEKLQGLQFLWVPKNTVTPEAIEKFAAARPDIKVYPQ
jgi:hypothetical protein